MLHHHSGLVLITVCAYLLLSLSSPARCQSSVDQCNVTNAALCQNGATCVDRGYDFTCNCSGTEFTGWFCNVSISQACSSTLCANGGVCQDRNVTVGGNLTTSFQCSCPSGYEGPLCEEPIDYCATSGVPCANNGTCHSHTQFANYTCDCSNTAGYEGVNCTDRRDDGPPINCGPGTSVDQTCFCPTEWTGVSCETPVDLCLNGSLCQHGQCRDNTCDCTGSGFTGPHCDIQENECNRTEPICQHGGECTDLEGTFSCNCTLGYYGNRCEEPRCDPNPCLNNGTCQTNDTHWSCGCAAFYEGDRCEIKGPCADKPCDDANSQYCSQSVADNSYNCTCKPGWEGKDCTQDIDECEFGTHDCVNGNCNNTAGNFTCICTPGYTGPRCIENIDDCAGGDECQNGGTCRDGINTFTCDCVAGFEGDSCADDVDECQENPVLCHEGRCINQPGSYSCDCGARYIGDHCEMEDPCYNTTCLNEGVCVKNKTEAGNYEGYCTCVGGFEGASCEKSPSTSGDSPDLAVIIGPLVGGLLFIIIIILIIAFVMTARSKRATRGAYSPSQQETSGSRVELGNVLKKPPEERLI